MSHSRNLSNGKRQSVADLENAVNELEDNITDMNKMFVRKVLSGLTGLMNSITHGETGIFRVVLKWFGLYLDVHTSINPDDTKLLKYFENTIPTIITYIIGCLQYKTKDIPNYHYELLNIFEQLLENVSPKVLTKIAKFEVGTIGYLWNPIDIVGDFNTQHKALKILSTLLKQFDDKRLNEELKQIKWTNSNSFQDKLRTIVQETKLSQHLENASRELLNNLNMNLSKSVLVYSLYCQSLEIGNRYTFYKPLNLHKFWIDVNYTPKTLSYSGRFKIYSKSRYENVNVIVEVQTMKLENGILFIQYKQPGEFSKHSDIFTNLSENVIKIHLSKDEEQRLEENNYIMEYFNEMNNLQNKNQTENHENRDIFDMLKGKTCRNPKDNKKDSSALSNTEDNSKVFAKTADRSINSKPKKNANHKFYKYILDSPPNQSLQYNSDKSSKSTTAPILNDSPKTSREFRNEEIKHPIMKLRDRKKFFFSLVEEDTEQDIANRKAQKRKSQNRKSRQSKARGKKVCKVTPTVDLTKIENVDEMKENEQVSLSKYSSPLISTQDCNKVLKNVANIYNIGDNSDAKPCQSYRQFKTDIISKSHNNTNSISAGRRHAKQTENSVDNLILTTKKCRSNAIVNENDESNKENVNPSTSTLTKSQSLQHNKRIISPHIFESQHPDIISPNKILRSSNTLVENPSKATIDLTFDEGNISNASFECEEVRGICETSIKSTTPMKTPVNVALLGNQENKLSTPRPPSAMNVSDFNDSDMELTQIPLNLNQTMKPNENNSNSNSITKAVQQILQDFECDSPIGKSKEQNFEFDNEKSCSGSNEAEKNNSTSIPQLFKTTELPIKRELIVMHSRPIYLCQQNTVWTTPDKTDKISTNVTTTKCQVTPTAVIMQQIQVSSKKSVILRNSKPKKFYIGNKAKKNLNAFYSKERLLNLKMDKLMAPSTNSEAVEQIESKDKNNNIIIASKYSNLKENCKERQNHENISPLALKHFKQSTSLRDYFQNLMDLNETSSSSEIRTPVNSQLLSIKGVEGDLHKIIQNHNNNIHLRLENAQRLFQSNISELYSKNVCELLQSIIQKSEKQKYELEQFLANIGKLIKEIQTQYETFVKQTKEYDINKEVINCILENFANMENHNIKPKDNQDLIEQLNKEHSMLLEKLLEIVLKNKTLKRQF
ncbi:hypothetical protein DOY81_007748 [Sarcophaga bullata]|nr:hypothetical protein DOY81_007748 [Sarcophaga bullata]